MHRASLSDRQYRHSAVRFGGMMKPPPKSGGKWDHFRSPTLNEFRKAAMQEMTHGRRNLVNDPHTGVAYVTEPALRPYWLKKVVLLIDQSSEGVTGWEVLQTIARLQGEYGLISRWLKRGVSQSAIQARLDTKNSLHSVLERLQNFGFLQIKGAAATLMWRLTPKGENLLAAGHPLTPGYLSKDEMHDLLDLRIEALEAQRQAHVEFFRELRKTQEKAHKMTDTITSPEQMATQKALIERLKVQEEVAQALCEEDEKRIQEQITEYRQAQIRLKMADVDERTLALLGQTSPRRVQFSEMASSLVDNITELYLRTASHVETEKGLTDFNVRQRVKEQLAALEQQALNAQAPAKSPPLADILNTGPAPQKAFDSKQMEKA